MTTQMNTAVSILTGLGVALAVLCCGGGQDVAHAQATESPAAPYALGGNEHLFLDEFLISDMTNVFLTVNPPQRKELVLIADKPWERNGITSYCNVFFDETHKEYRLYYVPIHLDSSPAFRLALATSKDGLHWEKPNLGVVEWQGTKETNIVIEGQREGTVMIDPNGSLDQRYVFLSSEGQLKTRLFTSPDGIHWTMLEKKISDLHSDSQISTFWDDQLRKYVHYPRVGHRGRATGRVETSTMDEIWPAEIPVVLSADDDDPPGMDLYTNSCQKYALAKNVYLAFPTPYYHYSESLRAYLNEPALQQGGNTNDGVIDTQLAVSRDGKTWKRYRAPYVPLYKHEDLDLKIAMVFPGMVYHDAHIDQYFGGYAFTHGDRQARRRLEGRALGGIFRLEQRIDGFVSADFAYAGGGLTTAPFTFEGNCLMLNLNTSAAGEGRVALLDAEGKPLAGYTIEECDFINGDYLSKPVSWRGKADVSSLAGKPARLRFEMRGAKLYAFQFKQVDLASLNIPVRRAALEIKDDLNVALRSKVTTSSTHHGGFEGEKAIDGIVPGYTAPIGEGQSEWGSDGQKEGAWIQLDWPEPVTVDTVLLYDRPNLVDQVLAGTITFSDGTSIAVPELPNSGEKETEVKLAPKRISWLRFTVDKVSEACSNAGLAEIVVRSVAKAERG
ncbi:MAG: hypothetical protein HY318_09225 [Armatimonadetes bacterium]|nr:hypothetical protein [Armatimonadota bacterium]